LLRSAVFWNYLTVALRSGAALLLLPLLLRKLSPEEMGLWYVFLALVGMGALLDLGFGNALNRAAGYLWAGADRLLPEGIGQTSDGRPCPEGRQPNFSGLGSLLVTMRWFYLLLGCLLLLLLELGGGAWVWYKSTGMENAASVRGAWAVFALGCALNTMSGLWPTLLTGINGVREAQKVFLVSLVANYIFSIGGLLAGWGLWGPVSGQVVMGLLNRGLGRAAFLRLAGPALNYIGRKPDPGLLKTLWPNSWRVGAVTLGIYLTMFFNTLLASVFLDLKDTASFGLSMQMAFFLSQVSSVWVLVKLPWFNQLRQLGQVEEIRRVFFARVWIFLLMFVVGSMVLCLLGDWILAKLLGARTALLPLPQRALLLLVVGLEAHHSLYRELVLTANVNPFVRPILLTAAASLTLVCLLAPVLGVWGLILAPGLAQALFTNWWIVLAGIRTLGMPVREYVPAFFQGLCRLPEYLRTKT
jgi:O-antigen/teichoic acid export membrane protein